MERRPYRSTDVRPRVNPTGQVSSSWTATRAFGWESQEADRPPTDAEPFLVDGTERPCDGVPDSFDCARQRNEEGEKDFAVNEGRDFEQASDLRHDLTRWDYRQTTRYRLASPHRTSPLWCAESALAFFRANCCRSTGKSAFSCVTLKCGLVHSESFRSAVLEELTDPALMAADKTTAAPSPGKLLGKQMIAGGTAGTLADAIMFPMMTVKSRLQVQGGGGSYAYKGPVDAIYNIAAKEGWRTLYKGFGTVCLIAPAQALYLGCYQTSKKLLPGGEDNPLVQFCGGAIATLIQSSVMVPTEVIRQRQMVQTSQEGAYTGSLHAIRTIYQHEGIMAFYRGFLLGQLVWGPYNAMYLPLWEGLKRASVRFSGAESMQKLEVQYELGSAFCASAVASALTNPADIVKTRLQVQGKSNKSSSTQYTGATDAARKIFAKEGLAGFTKGMSSRVLWVAPSATIMFTSYDQLMKRLQRMW